jgi:pimeloyl-ACP methyl ester carboxylesterase
MTIKFADTSVLRVGYEEWNGDAPRAVMLLHGWPDSPRLWRRVAPKLAAAGHRVIVPALRGFAPTRFRESGTMRSGQLAALGRDLIELIEALGLDRPSVVGHDWGARAVANACGLAPGIARHMVMISVGYGTNDPNQPLSLPQARNYWYHWYMATERGARVVREDRNNFARIMWDTWSPPGAQAPKSEGPAADRAPGLSMGRHTPPGWFDDAEFRATAEAFSGDDWPEVTIHSYRHRWGHAPGDPRYAADERALVPAPVLAVPTLVIQGGADACNPPETSAHKEKWFSGPYRREVLPGIGHFPPREAPDDVARLLLEFLEQNP